MKATENVFTSKARHALPSYKNNARWHGNAIRI